MAKCYSPQRVRGNISSNTCFPPQGGKGGIAPEPPVGFEIITEDEDFEIITEDGLFEIVTEDTEI